MLNLSDLLNIKILHDVNVQLWSSGVIRRIMSALNGADDDIYNRLYNQYISSGTARQLESLLVSVRDLNAAAYARVTSMTSTELFAIAGVEVAWLDNAYKSNNLSAVTQNQAYSAALSRPFQGRLLKEALNDVGVARGNKIRNIIRIGYLTGKSTDALVREIRGDLSVNNKNSAIEVDRRHLETVVRTAISHTASTTRELFINQNSELIKSQLWVSTLDSHTSTECIMRAGKRYTVGDKPKPINHDIPWCGSRGCGPGRLHYNCRSSAVGLLDGQETMTGTRASSGGQIDANTTYEEWLRQQSGYTKELVLGKARARLFDAGASLDKFVDAGRWITLAELKKRDEAAFKSQ